MQILCINTCATKHILYENYWLGDNFLLIGYVICKIYFQGKKNTINISIYIYQPHQRQNNETKQLKTK